jgi:ribulose-bisphosphate carboxylase large chain
MTLPVRPAVPGLSGERFRVQYQISGVEADARSLAETARVEQSVEFPAELVPDGDIRDQIMGQLDAFEPAGERRYLATISFAVETAGAELTQLLNLLWGTGSFFPGFRVERIELPPSLLAHYRGPRFGVAGLRERVRIDDRPLLCTAIKPMGLTPQHLAEMAHACALGGMDIIKDDHGICDQPFCRFEERVALCAQAVANANQQTGLSCLYVPNVTAPADQILSRARFARQAGAGGLLISPGLTGFDAMRQVADDDQVGLPIFSHPTATGHFVVHPEHGFSHYVFYGQMQRLAGADASIYIQQGGRFQVRPEDCDAARDGCRDPLGHIRPIMPLPGGGMTRERIADLKAAYGSEVIFLVGGGLHRMGPDLVGNVRQLIEAVQCVR